jgi:hypothetical protein
VNEVATRLTFALFAVASIGGLVLAVILHFVLDAWAPEGCLVFPYGAAWLLGGWAILTVTGALRLINPFRSGQGEPGPPSAAVAGGTTEYRQRGFHRW